MELRIQLSDKGKHTETKYDFKEIEQQADLGEFFKVVLKTLESNLNSIPDPQKYVLPYSKIDARELLNYPEQEERPKEFSWDNPTQPKCPGSIKHLGISKGIPRGDGRGLPYHNKHYVTILETLDTGEVIVLVEYSFDVKKWVVEDEPNFQAEIKRLADYYAITLDNIHIKPF